MTERTKPDNELEARISRLRSTVDEAMRDSARLVEPDRSTRREALGQASKWLNDASDPSTDHDVRVRLVLKTEAETCLYSPTNTLIADRIRLEDRLYRLSDTAKKAWLVELDKSSRGRPENEIAYRQLLRRLTYDLAEAAESFDRLAKERKNSLLLTLSSALAITIALGVAFFYAFTATAAQLSLRPDANAFLRSLPNSVIYVVLLAGSLGAMLTTTRSLIMDEKARTDLVYVVVVNMLVRVMFGAFYSMVFVFALVSHLLPLAPSTEVGLLEFFVVAGVAAGFSDQLFGQAISSFITSSGGAAKKSLRDKKA
jgi:hypothetical protein